MVSSDSPVQLLIQGRSARSAARVGRVRTPHGEFDTPAFMPVGTRGSVKGLMPGLVAATGAQIILGNTYHLLLRPGPGVVQRMGGLHEFSGWAGPMLTDSGGYQAYSLAATNSVGDDGVTFKSIVDGSDVTMTPESAIDAQNRLGADIIMAFDDCPPSVDPAMETVTQARLMGAVDRDAGMVDGGGADRGPVGRRKRVYDHAARLRQANERTVAWLERCRDAHDRWRSDLEGASPVGSRQRALFGIVQGGTDLDARTWSAERVCNVELPGYAIGGVAVGEGSDQIARVVAHTAPRLPDAKPRYLMGVGYERDLLLAVLAGVDMFDCVLPTRNGRNANAFTSKGQIRLRNAKFAEDPSPIEEGCDCAACGRLEPLGSGGVGVAGRGFGMGRASERPFSRAYIRHLFMAQEMLGPILVSLHNLRHFQRFMKDVRATVASDDWEALAACWPVAAAGLSAAFDLGLLRPMSASADK